MIYIGKQILYQLSLYLVFNSVTNLLAEMPRFTSVCILGFRLSFAMLTIGQY